MSFGRQPIYPSVSETAQPVKVFPVTKPPPQPPTRSTPPSTNPRVSALYDFDAQQPGDLSFRRGDLIEVLEKTDDRNGWWRGRCSGREGVFPGNYVQ
jgi:amphiphysin